jgi:hypothetical protein
MKQTHGHGGQRTGAGRIPTGRSVRTALFLSQADLRKLDILKKDKSRGEWVGSQIRTQYALSKHGVIE